MPPPTITSFTPRSGCAGTRVTITGSYFTGTEVKFGGTDAASFTVDSSTQITAVVGYGSTGNVQVITNGGTCTSCEGFFYSEEIPTLNEWAMILFSLLLLGSAVYVLRQRRKAGPIS
ncbi:MAG: IPTL-CTERM sorting domain-containing protein [Deltaproteobacteria bacterium]|nr:IPTL-CTERM sorting domain-containing protein [Deltaproteobacteria bacterium]